MNLTECLSNADIATLRMIANHYDLTCSRHSKLALMQEILYLFRSSKFVASKLLDWRQGSEEVFLRLGLESRRVYSSEELTGMFRQCREDAAAGVEEGVRAGWIYPTTKESGRLQYCLPKEIHDILQGETVSAFYAQIRQSSSGPVTYHEVDYAMIRDIDLFFQYLARHDVQLTTGGSMYKRHLDKILEVFEVPEVSLDGGWRFGYGRRFYDYPDRFALLYDFAYTNGFVDEGHDGMLRLMDGAYAWQATGQMERLRAVLQFYVSAYRRPIPRLPQIVRMISLASPTQWLAADDFLATCGDLVTGYYYDDRETVFNLRVLTMLQHLGVIRIGDDENKQTWFQITELGQQLLTQGTVAAGSESQPDARKVLIVQPNFEIFGESAGAVVMTEIASWTELKQGGPLQVYRISKQTVARAITGGKSVSDWLQYLQTHSQTPVPGNVERTLLEWESEFKHNSDSSSSSLSS